ncbi:MAG: 16S rRNA (guanine(527)-N(7))-methyltransferase RsmG [Opitutaceae bacterium]
MSAEAGDSDPACMHAVTETFPELPSSAIARFAQWETLMREWNSRINLISRQDIDHLVDHHLLHALALTRFVTFSAGARVLDVGTGGGLPGIPLAIVFPEVEFTLVDSVGKKIRAVQAMAGELGLSNLTARQVRAETMKGRFDYVLGRAVTALPRFLEWTRHLIRPGQAGSVANGWLYFKGTAWREELASSGHQPDHVYILSEISPNPFFQEKFLLHIRHDS